MSEKSDHKTLNLFPSWSEDSRVKISAKPEVEPALTENEVDFGQSLQESFAKYDPNTSSWKTSQRCLVTGWVEWSEKWPRAGMTVNGTAYQLQPSAPITAGTESLSSERWPTPRAQMARHACKPRTDRKSENLEEVVAVREQNRMWPTPSAGVFNLNEDPKTFLKRQAKWKDQKGYHNSVPLTVAVKMWPTPCARDWKDTGRPEMLASFAHKNKLACSVAASDTSQNGSLNPTWVEWLMGFPTGWTDCDASETLSSRKSEK